jgi:uncharacterized alkaline shock family protein YloU
MSAPTTAAPAAELTTPPAGAALAEPAQRGGLEVADRVVEKIAAQAATEVDAATGARRRRLGVAVGDTDRPQVSARVDGDLAVVAVVMSVAWPAPVVEVTEQVRGRIRGRLAELAGVRAAQVDVRVTALTSERSGGRAADRRVS